MCSLSFFLMPLMEPMVMSVRFGLAAKRQVISQSSPLRAVPGTQGLLLIGRTADQEEGGNHYLLGSPPFDLRRYAAWLPEIAALPDGFDAAGVAK